MQASLQNSPESRQRNFRNNEHGFKKTRASKFADPSTFVQALRYITWGGIRIMVLAFEANER